MWTVNIRLNTEHLTDKTKPVWRCIVDGTELKTNEIIINCPSYTTSSMEGDVVKYNIGCKPDRILMEDNKITLE